MRESASETVQLDLKTKLLRCLLLKVNLVNKDIALHYLILFRLSVKLKFDHDTFFLNLQLNHYFVFFWLLRSFFFFFVSYISYVQSTKSKAIIG